MEKFLDVLEKCPLFAGIAPREMVEILRCLEARFVVMQKDDCVLQEGETVFQIGIVLHGVVQLVRTDYYGNRSVVSRAEQGQVFGEAYAFSDAQALPIRVIAEMDGAVLMINASGIIACCSNACAFHKTLIHNLLHLVSAENLMLHERIDITSQRTTREKLLAYLLNQAKVQGSDCFSIPFDRQGLADYLEVERSGLSAEISKLRKEGILESEKSYFHLLKSTLEV